jgi:hypothetical protein
MLYLYNMKYLLLAVFILLGTFTSTFAQNVGGLDVSISSIPTDPLPGQRVQLQLISYSTNLNEASITWRAGGQIIDSGIGKKTLAITAPQIGETMLISANVKAVGFEEANTEYLIRPGSVELLWEAYDSYTPPFYKGKAMPSINSTIRVAAIPTFNAPKTISYVWSKNDTALPSSSGVNKSWITFKNHELNPVETIKVLVQNTFFSGSDTVTITPKNPSVIAYQKRDGFIEYANGALKDITTTQPGIILRFEPYYFSIPRSINQDLGFSMRAGEMEIAGESQINEIRLSRPEEGGNVSFKVLVHTIAYTLQNANKMFSIQFN